MREPGEDDAGEYWHTAQVAAHPLDNCGCPKPPDCYGTRGWHFNAAGEAYERCPKAASRAEPPVKAKRRGGLQS